MKNFNIQFAINHLVYKIKNTSLRLYPTPHIYVENVFPLEFYEILVSSFPNIEELKQMKNSAHGNDEIDSNRHYLSYRDGDFNKLSQTQNNDFWNLFFLNLLDGKFSGALNSKFFKYLDWPRLIALGQHDEVLLIDDLTGFQIGPHTDTPQKIWSSLFYLPLDTAYPNLGTSLFSRKKYPCRKVRFTDSWFRNGGDPILDFVNFDKVWSAPYVPNSMFAFVRTRNSFHGVEGSSPDISRKIIIYESFSMRNSRFLSR